MTDLVQLSTNIRRSLDIFTTRSMHDWTRFVRASGLSMAQFGILMNLYYRHNCGVSDIGEHMHISAAAASQLIDKLVQSGLLERTEHPTDRRARLITLSTRGRALVESGLEARSRWMDDLVSYLSVSEYETISSAINMLTEAAGKLDAQTGQSTHTNDIKERL